MKSIEEAIKEISTRHQSFYIYDESVIVKSIETLKKDFSCAKFLYSAKTNPFPAVVKCCVKNGLGIDAASLNEVLMGEREGLSKDGIYYSAPGKTRFDIVGAIEKSIIIADSLNEIDLINSVASEIGVTADIGVRINPDFTFDSPHGAPGKFGIDTDQLLSAKEHILSLKNINVIGIHVHSRSQELNSEILKKYYENMLKLALLVKEEFKIDLKFVNMGGGMGIPYSPTDTTLDVVKLGNETALLMESFKEKLENTQIFIETGRYAVGKSGTYVTTVIDKKVSYGKTFVILNATLNGFIRPSIAVMVEGYSSGLPYASEPLYTKPNAFKFDVLDAKSETETVTLCGSLCTGTDVIAKDIVFPKLEIGDVVTISNAGSYAAVLSPMQFASLTPPAQIFFTEDGKY